MSTVSFVLEVDGVAADATSVVLSDATGSYGVKRDDTDAAVVDDGTAMTKTATGHYAHTFDDPDGFLDSTYTYAIEAVYGGETYRWQYTQAGPTSASLVSVADAYTGDARLVITWQDMIDYAARYLGGEPASQADAVRIGDVVRDAVEMIASAHPWRFLVQIHRLNAVAPFTTGTVAIAEGAVTVTLTGASPWPSWAASAELVVSGDKPVYRVKSRDSDTVLTLEADTPFASDDVTTATFSLNRIGYALPDDVRLFFQPEDETLGHLVYVPPNRWLRDRRFSPASTGYPYRFTVFASDTVRGYTNIYLDRPLDAARTYDLVYIRRPRALYANEAGGTVTLASGSAAVTGASTAFTDYAAGAVLRVSTDTTIPDGRDGACPFAEAYFVKSVASTAAMTLASNATASRSAVGYRLSDPVDLDMNVCRGVLYAAIKDGVDDMLPKARRGKDTYGRYLRALADARSREPRVADMGAMGPDFVVRDVYSKPNVPSVSS